MSPDKIKNGGRAVKIEGETQNSIRSSLEEEGMNDCTDDLILISPNAEV